MAETDALYPELCSVSKVCLALTTVDFMQGIFALGPGCRLNPLDLWSDPFFARSGSKSKP